MSDSNKFWVSINIVFATTLVAILYISTNYWKDQNKKIVDLIGTGINPVSAMCAMQNNYRQIQMCDILSTKAEDDK